MTSVRVLKLLALSVLTLVFASPASAGRLSRGLQEMIDSMAPSDEIKVLVVMNDPLEADIRSLDERLRATRAPMAVRHREVVETLQSTAARSQQAFLADLETAKAAGPVRGYTAHWIVNGVVVVTTVEHLSVLAARPDVDVIEANLEVELIEPIESAAKGKGVERRGSVGLLPGIDAVDAPRVWTELGIDGTGALVGNMDTGVQLSHPALNTRWRGHTAPVAECWRDAVGFGHATPTDTHSHGTHVMGTITGFAPGDTIGVAPGALWIADNTINQGASSEFDNDVLSGLAWFADPDGNPGTTDDVPDVVQNSWGVHEGFSGYVDCDSRWWTAIDNCEAAGVCLTWSAGNEGPGSTSLRSPADRADGPYNAFSVGATIATAPYTIASFSSRGPSGCGGPDATKPEVVAPGDDILSSVPSGGYDFKSGTSMSGPHVAGVVALMRAANPDVDVQTIKEVLMATAVDLGTSGEDNTYGHGMVNAYDAVLQVIVGYGRIEGTILDATTTDPIEGAIVSIQGDSRTATTDSTGFFRFILPPDDYTLEYAAFGYVSATQPVTVEAELTANGDLSLTTAPTARLSGVVTDYTAATVENATVTVLGTPLSPVNTIADGSFEIFLPDSATYTVRASFPGLGPDTESVMIAGDTVQDFELAELTWEGFETGDFSLLPWSMGGDAPWTIDTTDPQEGTYCARSGVITHNDVSVMEMQLSFRDPGDVEFWYKVSSEANYDYLRFFIDGAEKASWAGEVPWAQASFPVTAGEHTVRWEYTKDGSVSSGFDAAWVDVVTMPPVDFADIAVSAPSVTQSMPQGDTDSQLLTITNAGAAPLSYTAELSGQYPVLRTPQPQGRKPHEHLALRKGEADPRRGDSPIAGNGGPDAFGYSWIDSDDLNGPAYGWVEISGVGTPLVLGDDGNSGPLPLGFDFTFYGVTYNSVYVCTNGWVSFTSTLTTYQNDPVPDVTGPNALVAPFWDDLNPNEGGALYYYADAANDRFIVEWDAIPHYGPGDPQTFQVILNDDDSIVYQYETVSQVTDGTVGIENGDGTVGLEVVFNAAYLHDDLAVVIAAADPWLQLSPTSGVIAAGEQEDLTLDFDSTGLPFGEYDANLTINSNDPDESPMVVPVTLTVVDPPTGAPVVAMPTRLSLSRPFPNPFGNRTAIRLEIPAGGANADLSVFDVTGRRVAQLLSGPQPAGFHLVSWDGRDSGGKRVAAGTYFYRFRAGDYEQTRRVVRIR